MNNWQIFALICCWIVSTIAINWCMHLTCRLKLLEERIYEPDYNDWCSTCMDEDDMA
jgi:hypothetical protein